jgi:hypothetical protein
MGTRVDWDEVQVAMKLGTISVLAIDEALERLEERDPQAARVGQAAIFCGADGGGSG